LVDPDGLLCPVDIVEHEVDHLRDPQAAPEHEQEKRLIHGVADLRKQLLHLVLREGFGQWAPPTHHVTRFDRIPRDASLLNEIVKEMFQRMQTPMEGGRG
jgi:hypothetical protein